MKTLRVYTALIPSETSNICNVIKDIFLYFEEHMGVLDEDRKFELKVILNELIINAVKHGNKGDIGKCVKITAGVSQRDYAFFIIEDEGDGYDYNCLMENNNCQDFFFDIDICDMKETGRGIRIVRNLCDCIKFNKKGNKVVVLKKLREYDISI